jgi:diphthine synthase
MLYLIGLGLWDENDLPLGAIEKIKKCQAVFCELYTNKWAGSLKKIEELVDKKIKILERLEVESDMIIELAKSQKVALLIPGDPMTATTHSELIIAAKKARIKVHVIHASSIYTAVGQTGLQMYKFSRSTTLVFPEQRFKPTSPYEVIAENKKMGLHTLVLLDIKYDIEKYMSIPEAIGILMDIEDENRKGVIKSDTMLVACCQLGSENQIIRYDSAKNLMNDKELINKIPAALIFPGKLHFKEEEMLNLWKKN